MNNPTRDCSIRMPIRSLLALAALAIASGCGSAGSSSEDPAPEAVPTETPQVSETNADGETLCSIQHLGVDDSNGFEIGEDEVYSFPRINERLERFPELVEATGIDRVSDCEGARTFMQRYYDFKASNPDFDDTVGPSKEEQFREFLSDPENIAANGIEGPEVDKILGGPVADAAKTLMLVYKLSDGSNRYCSATRLAGPLFLTSAHCIPNPTTIKPSQAYQIYIKRRRPDGTVGWYGGSNGRWIWAYAIPYPGYMGTADRDRDIALVHVHSDYYSFLRAEGDTWNANMLLATRTPAVGDLQSYYGWGPASETEPFANRTARWAGQEWPVQSVSAHYFANQLSMSNPITYMCRGDSGGPSVRSLMQDGVFSGHSPNFDTNKQCPPLNTTVYWTRSDDKIEWLKKSMAQLQSGFKTVFYCQFVPGHPSQPDNAEHLLAFLSCYQTRSSP